MKKKGHNAPRETKARSVCRAVIFLSRASRHSFPFLGNFEQVANVKSRKMNHRKTGPTRAAFTIRTNRRLKLSRQSSISCADNLYDALLTLSQDMLIGIATRNDALRLILNYNADAIARKRQ